MARTSALKNHKHSHKNCKKVTGTSAVFSAAVRAAHFALTSTPRPMCTPILTGQRWFDELLAGHPTRFHQQIGMQRSAYRKLSQELQLHHGLRSNKYVSADEQLSMFLYLARTGGVIVCCKNDSKGAVTLFQGIISLIMLHVTYYLCIDIFTK